jgi:hypothetical protein
MVCFVVPNYFETCIFYSFIFLYLSSSMVIIENVGDRQWMEMRRHRFCMCLSIYLYRLYEYV